MNQRFPSNSTSDVIIGRLCRLPSRATVVNMAVRMSRISFRSFFTDPLLFAALAGAFFGIRSPFLKF
jgi:hypothetical protein